MAIPDPGTNSNSLGRHIEGVDSQRGTTPAAHPGRSARAPMRACRWSARRNRAATRTRRGSSPRCGRWPRAGRSDAVGRRPGPAGRTRSVAPSRHTGWRVGGEGFEAVRHDGHQLRDGGEVPVESTHLHVAEVGRRSCRGRSRGQVSSAWSSRAGRHVQLHYADVSEAAGSLARRPPWRRPRVKRRSTAYPVRGRGRGEALGDLAPRPEPTPWAARRGGGRWRQGALITQAT